MHFCTVRAAGFFLSDFTSTTGFYDIELFTVHEAGHVKQAPLARQPILQTPCGGIQPHLQMHFSNEQLQRDKDYQENGSLPVLSTPWTVVASY